MRRIFHMEALAFLCVAALSSVIVLSVSASDGNGAILIDGAEQSGIVAVSGGAHTIMARSDADIACIAVYENGQFKAASFSAPLEYDFPDSGAEIALFSLDSQFRPLREAVRVTQGAAPSKLVYSGESVCYDEWNDYEEREFDDYTVRLKVIAADGKITEIRDIGGYESSGKATNDANAHYLVKAAAELPARIIEKQSPDGVDAVTGATCASRAILRAVKSALDGVPEPYEDSADDTTPVPDGVYAGTAQCLTGYINYMVDADITVKDGVLTEIKDRTLKTPMSSNDKVLYSAAWRKLSGEIAKGNIKADDFNAIDAVSGATVSSAGINAAIRNALQTRTPAQEVSGDLYAPEGISLYARAYPVVTVANGEIANIRIVPAKDTDTERLEAFAAEIVRKQSVNGLTWPDAIQDDAFAVANLTDQILYGMGVLK